MPPVRRVRRTVSSMPSDVGLCTPFGQGLEDRSSSILRQFPGQSLCLSHSPQGPVLLCRACETSVSLARPWLVARHCRGKRHQRSLARQAGSQAHQSPPQDSSSHPSTSLDSAMATGRRLSLRLAFCCAASGIPFSTFQRPWWRDFFIDFCGFPPQSRRSLMRNLPVLAAEEMSAVRSAIGDHPISVIVDGTTDATGHHCNVVCVYPLTDQPAQSFCIAFRRTTESVTAKLIANEVREALGKLWPDDPSFENRVRGLVTDQASTMLAVGRLLKETFPLMKHVTCVVHALHNVSERALSECCPLVVQLLSLMRQLFLASSRRRLWHQVTKLPLPQLGVTSRFGSVLSAAVNLINVFAEVCQFASVLKDGTRPSMFKGIVMRFTSLVADPRLVVQLAAIQPLGFIPPIITKLESERLPLAKSRSILQDVYRQLLNLSADKIIVDSIPAYFERLISRNPDLSTVLSEDGFPFFLLNSMSAERAFSLFRFFFTHLRHRLTSEHIEQFMICMINAHRTLNKN